VRGHSVIIETAGGIKRTLAFGYFCYSVIEVSFRYHDSSQGEQPESGSDVQTMPNGLGEALFRFGASNLIVAKKIAVEADDVIRA